MALKGDADVSGGGDGLDAFGGILRVDVAGGVLFEPGVHCGEGNAHETFEGPVFEAKAKRGSVARLRRLKQRCLPFWDISIAFEVYTYTSSVDRSPQHNSPSQAQPFTMTWRFRRTPSKKSACGM